MNTKKVLVACLIGVSLLSCYGPKMAERQVDKAILKEPGVAAAQLRKAFPCEILAHTDTLEVPKDSLIYIECPEGSQYGGDYFGPDSVKVTYWRKPDGTLVAVTDTSAIGKNPGPGLKTIRVPVMVKIPGKIITRYVKDGADEKVITDLTKRLAGQELQTAKYRGKFNMWKWIAIGLMALITLYIALKIFATSSSGGGASLISTGFNTIKQLFKGK